MYLSLTHAHHTYISSFGLQLDYTISSHETTIILKMTMPGYKKISKSFGVFTFMYRLKQETAVVF